MFFLCASQTFHQEMTASQMDALLDRLRIVRAFDISTVISTLVAYVDGVIAGVVRRDIRLRSN